MQAPASGIYVLGGPGSGVSTFGKALAGRLQRTYLDVDDFYWFTGDPLPYRRKRNKEHRRSLLLNELEKETHWVLGGALGGWAEDAVSFFVCAFYIHTPVDIRLARIREREIRRYGEERISPNGDLHGVFEKFCTWAAAYDSPSENKRSGSWERAWLAGLGIPVMELDGTLPVDTLTENAALLWE